jgi:hypothetical protein
MSKKQKKVSMAIVVIVALALGAFALVYGRTISRIRTTAATKSSSTTSLSTSTLQGDSQQNRIEAELITVRPTGFEPKEITRPEGQFLLAIDNRSGLQEIEFRLDRAGGGSESHVRVPRNKIDWRGLIDLRPGVYLLREANHPDWICRITIEAK